MEQEASQFIDMIAGYLSRFWFRAMLSSSCRRDRSVSGAMKSGTAEGALAEALSAMGLDWEELPGEGAFYGPKIEFF